ncbi:MAG: hypothetical protein LJE95_13635 [Acidobacteria bacterium]|nr:hypothetical protein [Acidobacteriota bacterium]
MAESIKTLIETETRTHEAEPERPQQTLAGLCATCVEAPHCVWLRERGPAMVACEEFRAVRGPRLSLAAAADSTSAPEVDTALGLCATCAHAESCVLRREGGVWFCEEYE